MSSLTPGVYFLPVGEFCRRELLFCAPGEAVQGVAVRMRAQGVSSAVVQSEGETLGIITDRDLRNKVVAAGVDAGKVTAASIMNAPLVVVNEADTLFEVVYQMSRHGIHRVGVVDGDNRLCGMVNEADLIRIQSRSPQQILRALETARTVEDLGVVRKELADLVLFLFRAGVGAPDIMRLLSHLNDQVVRRLVAHLRSESFADLPDAVAFVVLGSEGRGEQTLYTDQDNAIIYGDDLTPSEIARVEAFSQALIDALIAIGVPECSGGIMAKNPDWRRSLAEWARVVDGWVALPEGENTLRFSMFSDVRLVWGDASLVEALREGIRIRTRGDSVFLTQLAAKALRFAPPLGFFGGFKVEKGEHKGGVDLKTAGIYAITEGVKVLGLSVGFLGGTTLEKIRLLQGEGILSAGQAADLAASFTFLSSLRLGAQVAAISSGRELSNYITVEELNRVEKGHFHVTLEVVKTFEGFLRNHFRLNMIVG